MRKSRVVSSAVQLGIVVSAVVGFWSTALSWDGATSRGASPASPGPYVRFDVSTQSIGLPHYDLGLRRVDGATLSNRGPVLSHDPRASGAGFAAAIGYVLPVGLLPVTFGSNVRIELDGSYVRADATNSGAPKLAIADPFSLQQLLDGRRAYAFGAGTGTLFNANVVSDHSAWRLGLKIASDHRLGAATLTPWFAAFGGESRTRQTYSHLAIDGNTPFSDYDASTSLRWRDLGAKVGLSANIDVTPWLALGLGGSVGAAHRSAALDGNDIHVGFNGLTFDTVASSIATHAHSTAFLANLEASIAVRPFANTAVRVFGGLNYDSDTPGLLAPSFASLAGGVPQSPTAAGIKFEETTSYYAGLGLTVRFAP